MQTFEEYIETEQKWTWNYVWSYQDTEDLDVDDPTDEDVENAISEIVKEEGLGSGAPDYRLPDYITIDFTALEKTDLIPYSFHVDSYSKNPEDAFGRDYSRDSTPQIKNKKIMVNYAHSQ